MTVLRVHKTSNYTVMSNYHFKEKEMSLKAKGLLSLMLSLPDSWDYSINGLVAICKENETAIVSTLKELKKFGYLEIKKLMPNQTKSGRIEYIYNIYEIPNSEKLGVEKQDIEKLGVEFQGVENQGQLSTNELNTEELNKNNKLIKDNRTLRFTPPTLEEVKNYCKERNNNVDAERFIDYYTSNGWKVGKNSMKDWKAAIRTWERSNTKETTKKSEFSDISKKVREQNKNVTFEYNEEELNF